MKRQGFVRSSAIAIAAWSMVASSVASAAATPAASVNPLVALSAFGTAESRAAVAAQPVALPVAATTAVAAQDDPYRTDRGANMLPLLIAIAALVAAWLLLDDAVLGDGDGDIDIIPISPS